MSFRIPTAIILIIIFTMVLPAGYAEDKPSLAVFDFNVVGLDDEMGIIPADFFRSYLFKTGKFNLVSRESMQVIMDEMKLQESGCTSEECFVKLGQILLAQYVITGKLYKLEETYFITVNFISVADAVILYSDKSKIEDIFNVDIVCGRMVENMIQALFNVRQQVVETYDYASLRYEDKEGRVTNVIDKRRIEINKGLKHGVSNEVYLYLFRDKEKYAVFKIYEVNKETSKASLYTRLKKISPQKGDHFFAPHSPSPWDILPKSYAHIRLDSSALVSGLFELRCPFPKNKRISFFSEAKVCGDFKYRHILVGARVYFNSWLYAAVLCKYSDIDFPINSDIDCYSWTGSYYTWYERYTREDRGRSVQISPGIELGGRMFSSKNVSYEYGIRYILLNRGTEEVSRYYREYYDSGELQRCDLWYDNEYQYASFVLFMGVTFKI
ncbi:hypothetical protein KAU32_09300 [bacterium]|nr:hypothetical protein [bacterium]